MGIRKPLFVAALAMLFVAVSYMGIWFYARVVALEIIADWVSEQRQAGYRIAHGPPQTGGFPFVVQIRLDAVSIAPAGESWRWGAGALGLEIRPWNFRRIRLEAFGAQRIMAARNGAETRMVLTASEAVAIVTIAKSGRVTGATLRLREPRLSGDTGDVRAAELWLEAAAPSPSAPTVASFTLSLAATDWVLPAALNSALGRKIETLRAEIDILGAIPGGPFGDAVESWRKAGGRIEVKWLHVTWGAVDFQARGTLALDDEGRPLGALTADIRGFGAALDALQEASVVREKTANLAKIGLALLARKPPGGGAPVLRLPLTAQAGKLYFGPIKIADLPRIRFRVQPR